MTIYQFFGNKLIVANNANEFVTKLHDSSIFPVSNNHDYMSQLAKRAYVVFGYSINTSSEEHFLADLIYYKLVDIYEPN